MSERFVRCPHCRLPHNVETTLCPVTNKPISLAERKSENGKIATPSLTPPPVVPARLRGRLVVCAVPLTSSVPDAVSEPRSIAAFVRVAGAPS